MMAAGCTKGDDADADVYTLPPDLTEAEIISLIYEAEKAMESAQKRTVVYSADVSIDGLKHRYRSEEAYDADAKKRIELSYRTYQGQTKLTDFSYVEGADRYCYSFSPHSADGKSLRSEEWFNNLLSGAGTTAKEIQKPTTDADKFYCPRFNIIGLDRPIGQQGDWTVENGKIVCVDTGWWSREQLYYQVSRYEIALTASKRYKHIKRSNYANYMGEERISNGEYTLTYSTATPALPEGFSKSDFADKRSEYCSVRVVWDEGKGENTFWVKQGNQFYLDYVSDYAPAVAGKEVAGCTIGSQMYTCRKSSYGEYCYPPIYHWSPNDGRVEVSNSSVEVRRRQ
jgi:hypothetical protein